MRIEQKFSLHPRNRHAGSIHGLHQRIRQTERPASFDARRGLQRAQCALNLQFEPAHRFRHVALGVLAPRSIAAPHPQGGTTIIASPANTLWRGLSAYLLGTCLLKNGVCLRTIRVVSAMSAASPLYRATDIVSLDRPRRKMPTGDIALAASCCATITPE